MANDKMTGFIHQIENAVKGEEVRDSIIKAINAINVNTDANTLEGHSSSYFAKQDDMDNVYPLATKVEANSSCPVTSGAVYTYVSNIGNWLNNILGEASSNEAIVDKLINVYRGKDAVVQACIYAGAGYNGDLTRVTFSQIADWIREKVQPGTVTDPDGNPVNINFMTLNVTENNKEGYVPDDTGTAWNKVVVNVQPKLSELTVNSVDIKSLKKTFKPDKDEDEFEGYSSVTVNISNRIKELKIDKLNAKGKGTFKVTDEYDEDDEENAIYGYSKVTVDVSDQLITKVVDSADDLPDDPSKIRFSVANDNKSDDDDDDDSNGYPQIIGYTGVKIDITPKLAPLEVEVDAKNFGEEQTFIASEDERGPFYGYKNVVIKVVESEGPFTVTFYNGRTKLKTYDDVEKGQSFTYDGPKPEEEGKAFKGWNPEPINVTHDMDCYAEFRASSHIGFDSEIPNSWADIAANGGADIPLGAFKILYSKPYTYDNIEYPGFSLLMQKVGHGEGSNSTSTWLSLQALPRTYRLYTNENDQKREDFDGWMSSDLRQFLNNGLLNAIAACTESKYAESAGIVSAIKSVTKYTRSYDRDTSDPKNSKYTYLPNVETDDKIWVPSFRELYGASSTSRATECESAGPMYKILTKTEDGEDITFPNGYGIEGSGGRLIIRSTLGFTAHYAPTSDDENLKKFNGLLIGESAHGASTNYSLTGIGSGSSNPLYTYAYNEPSYIEAYKTKYGSKPTTFVQANSLKVHIGFCT